MARTEDVKSLGSDGTQQGLWRPVGGQIGRHGPLFLLLHNLLLANERGLFLPEINLIVQTVRLVDDRLNHGLDNLSARHGDADVVADFALFGRHYEHRYQCFGCCGSRG